MYSIHVFRILSQGMYRSVETRSYFYTPRGFQGLHRGAKTRSYLHIPRFTWAISYIQDDNKFTPRFTSGFGWGYSSFQGVFGLVFFFGFFFFVFVVSLVCSMLTVSLECPNSIAPLAFSDVYFSSTDLHNITAILLKVAVKTQNPLTLLHTTSTSSSL